jgi:GH24 family phage-related lysozyme (muramidase)
MTASTLATLTSEQLSNVHGSGNRVTSDKGINFIKSFEGFEPNLYNDPAGHCTIGYGKLLHKGNCNGASSETPYLGGISESAATDLLRTEVAGFEHVVNNAVTTDLNQNQFDAMVSFTYNVGSGNLQKSTLLAKVNEGDYEGAAHEFGKWTKAGGHTLPGLVRRRAAEEKMFSGGGYG